MPSTPAAFRVFYATAGRWCLDDGYADKDPNVCWGIGFDNTKETPPQCQKCWSFDRSRNLEFQRNQPKAFRSYRP